VQGGESLQEHNLVGLYAETGKWVIAVVRRVEKSRYRGYMLRVIEGRAACLGYLCRQPAQGIFSGGAHAGVAIIQRCQQRLARAGVA
jgi:hypothetical protein